MNQPDPANDFSNEALRESVLERLRGSLEKLHAVGVLHAAVFGSVARGEARFDSDVDILIDLDPDAVIGLFKFVRIQQELAAVVMREVDVVSRSGIRPGGERRFSAMQSRHFNGARRIYGTVAPRDAKQLAKHEISDDDIRCDAILYRLQCVSEATTQLLMTDPDIQEKYPEMPWSQIKGIADVTRHAYRSIAPEVVWGAINGGDLEALLLFARRELGIAL